MGELMKNKLAVLTGILAAGVLVACSAITSNGAQSATRVFPTPTKHVLFQGNVEIDASDSPVSLAGAPTISSAFLMQSSATPSPVVTSTPILQATATQTVKPEFFTVAVYDDSLNPNWEMQKDTGVDFDLKSASPVYRGQSAISFIPNVKNKTQYGSLFFTVSDKSKEAYLQDQIVTLSFWLYSGDKPIPFDAMAVALVGSNSQPFWKADDHSVLVEGKDAVFSETRLYYLGFSRDIPANTWVQVEVDLDNLIYDPIYKYVTGFYLKMEAGFSQTLAVDDVNLIMLGEPSEIRSPEFTSP
jgi:hypothetical protein